MRKMQKSRFSRLARLRHLPSFLSRKTLLASPNAQNFLAARPPLGARGPTAQIWDPRLERTSPSLKRARRRPVAPAHLSSSSGLRSPVRPPGACGGSLRARLPLPTREDGASSRVGRPRATQALHRRRRAVWPMCPIAPKRPTCEPTDPRASAPAVRPRCLRPARASGTPLARAAPSRAGVYGGKLSYQ